MLFLSVSTSVFVLLQGNSTSCLYLFCQYNGISHRQLSQQCHQHSPSYPPDGSKSPQHHQQCPVQLWVLGGGWHPGQGK